MEPVSANGLITKYKKEIKGFDGYLYRGDSRPPLDPDRPGQGVFERGFRARGLDLPGGADYNMDPHLSGSEYTRDGYVSTTLNEERAAQYAAKNGRGYVYKIDLSKLDTKQLYDVFERLGKPKNPDGRPKNPSQATNQEIAVQDNIPAEAIDSAVEVQKTTTPKGESKITPDAKDRAKRVNRQPNKVGERIVNRVRGALNDNNIDELSQAVQEWNDFAEKPLPPDVVAAARARGGEAATVVTSTTAGGAGTGGGPDNPSPPPPSLPAPQNTGGGPGIGTGVGAGIGTGIGAGIGTGIGTDIGTGVGIGTGIVAGAAGAARGAAMSGPASGGAATAATDTSSQQSTVQITRQSTVPIRQEVSRAAGDSGLSVGVTYATLTYNQHSNTLTLDLDMNADSDRQGGLEYNFEVAILNGNDIIYTKKIVQNTSNHHFQPRFEGIPFKGWGSYGYTFKPSSAGGDLAPISTDSRIASHTSPVFDLKDESKGALSLRRSQPRSSVDIAKVEYSRDLSSQLEFKSATLDYIRRSGTPGLSGTLALSFDTVAWSGPHYKSQHDDSAKDYSAEVKVYFGDRLIYHRGPNIFHQEGHNFQPWFEGIPYKGWGEYEVAYNIVKAADRTDDHGWLRTKFTLGWSS